MRTLYPDIEPFDTGTLKVDDRHTLYYEQCGNPQGKPVVGSCREPHVADRGVFTSNPPWPNEAVSIATPATS